MADIEDDTREEGRVSPEMNEIHVGIGRIDDLFRRMRLWILTGGMVVAVGSATIGWIIRKSTMDVRQHIAETSAGLERLERTQRNTAVQDSIRFERVMDVVEIAVVAIIEPDGSAEQKSAIEDLRHRRHVVPITP